jgi:hypothetical protein
MAMHEQICVHRKSQKCHFFTKEASELSVVVTCLSITVEKQESERAKCRSCKQVQVPFFTLVLVLRNSYLEASTRPVVNTAV